MKQLLANKCSPVLEHPPPPHSVRLALWLLPVPQTQCQPVDEVKLKMMDLLNIASADGLQHCLEQCYMDWEESTLKGIEINL
jgi:hypothetical protein